MMIMPSPAGAISNSRGDGGHRDHSNRHRSRSVGPDRGSRRPLTPPVDTRKMKLAQLLEWEKRFHGTVLEFHSDRNLVKFTSKNLAITESYAGSCAGSFALGRAFDYAKLTCGNAERSWYLHFACDSGSAQQELISLMSGPHKPRHLFSNILDRLQDDDRELLDDFIAATFAAHAMIVIQKNEGLMTQDDFLDTSRGLSDDMFQTICDRLETATFRSSSFAKGKRSWYQAPLAVKAMRRSNLRRRNARRAEHGSRLSRPGAFETSGSIAPPNNARTMGKCKLRNEMCSICPPRDGADTIWVEIAGNTCCPWSNLNKSNKRGLLDPATYPMWLGRGVQMR